MQRRFRELNDCVEIYKSGNRRDKNEAYKAIQEHLTHHINSLCNIICGTNYNVSSDVFRMIYRGLHASAPNMAWSSFNIDEMDLRQQIDLIILQLIDSYTYNKVSFLQFITFLLPRRISSFVVKESRCIMNQYGTDIIDDYTGENDYYFKVESNEAVDVPDRLSFLTDEEFNILTDYSSGMTVEEIMRHYHMPSIYATEQRIKELVFRTANILKAVGI